MIAALILPLAIFVGIHSLSSVKMLSSSREALQIYPLNGLAQASVAFDRFFEIVGQRTEALRSSSPAIPGAIDTVQLMDVLGDAALATASDARRAYQLEPLSPKAHVILALTEEDLRARNEIIESASRLNKRQLALQGLLLDKNIAEGSYAKSIETIDQILRAHPEVSERFFPLLVQVLSVDDTIPLFSELFARPLPWRQPFLNFALKDDRVLINLAELRRGVVLDNEGFDRRLIGRLVDRGDLSKAAQVYELIRPAARIRGHSGRLDWNSDYPPLDWKLASGRGLNAYVLDDGRALALSVSPGRGGVIASRVIFPQVSRFSVRVDHDLDLSDRLGNLRLEVRCTGAASPFFVSAIERVGREFAVDASYQSCDAYEIALSARAWTGSTPLRGSISSVWIEPISGV